MERSELQELKEELQRMQRRIDELEGASPETPVNRRNMLRGLGAAAVGAAASGLAFARPAAAVDGNNIVIGNDTQTANSPTMLIKNASYSASPAVGMFHVTDDGTLTDSFVASTALISAAASNNGFITAFAGQGATYGAKLDAPVPLKLRDSTAAGAPSNGGSGYTGQIKIDDGDLWLCVDHSGLFGGSAIWRRITGPDEAGSYHPVTPARVYDTRATIPGAMTAGSSRTISVSSALGPPVVSNFVPAGATAIVANLTIFATTGSGYLSVNPGGVSNTSTATVNWNAAGQVANQGLTFKLDGSRQLNVQCTGGGTGFTLDVFGYYL